MNGGVRKRDQWYELYCKPNLKYNTQIGYLRIIETHLKPHFGHYRLKAVTSAALQEYANSLKTEGYAKSYLTGILSVFSAAMDYAVEPLHDWILHRAADFGGICSHMG